MKLLVIGDARYGKDTVCSLLKNFYNLTFVSSSWFVGECAVRPFLADAGIRYNSMGECYADRHNHRADWFDAIALYNKNDPARLGRELFSQYDIYCGLRNRREFDALKTERTFDVCLWVDRSKIIKPEPRTSMTLDCSVADYIVDNNGTLEDLEVNILEIMDRAMDDGKIEHRTPIF